MQHALITDEGDGFACGYIDKTGKYVINPRGFTSSYPLSSGCNGFSTGGFAYSGTDTTGYSVIDNTGKIIFTYRR